MLSLLPSLVLAGCAAWCPNLQPSGSSSCQATISKLQAQDSALKDTVNSAAVLEKRLTNARVIQGNLRVLVEPLPAQCPASIANPLAAEVKQRIGQIDAYISTGTWVGPVG